MSQEAATCEGSERFVFLFNLLWQYQLFSASTVRSNCCSCPTMSHRRSRRILVLCLRQASFQSCLLTQQTNETGFMLVPRNTLQMMLCTCGHGPDLSQLDLMEAPAICYLSVASIWAGHDQGVNIFACGPESRGRRKTL